MLYCDHTIRWVFGARESDVRNVAGHIFQTVYIPLDVRPILLRRPIMVPRQMCGGVLRHYGGAAFHACNDAVPLRMDEMPGENVGIRWRGCVHCLIDLPGCRFVGPWDGVASSGFGCLYGLGATPPVIYLRRPPSLPMPVPVLRPILTSSKPKNSPTASTCDCAIPALVRFRCLSHAGAPVWGRAPRWNIKTDLTPPTAATLSRDPTRFGRQKIRGSPVGGTGSYLCEFGAVRPCFFQRFTVKGSRSGAAYVRVGI